MKKFKLLFVLVVCSMVMSCKTDPPDTRTNEISLNGESYSMTGGLLESYGLNNDGSYDWDVTLYGETLDYDNSTFTYTGAGPKIYMDLNSESSLGLVSGTYNYEGGTRAAFVMFGGNLVVDFNSVNSEYNNIVSGTVDVEVGTNSTSFDFSFTNSDGNTITGYYEGVLQEI